MSEASLIKMATDIISDPSKITELPQGGMKPLLKVLEDEIRKRGAAEMAAKAGNGKPVLGKGPTKAEKVAASAKAALKSDAARAAAKIATKALAKHAGVSVQTAPAAEQIVREMRPPKTKGRRGDKFFTVEHTEYVGDVAIGADSATGLPRADGAFGIDLLASINPGNSTLFPWLANEARGYQEYAFKRLTFQLANENPSTIGGMLGLAVTPDATEDPPVTKAELLNMKAAARAPVWKAEVTEHLPIGDINADMRWRFVRGDTVPDNTDIKMYDAGQVIVGSTDVTEGAVAETELWVKYVVEFRTPVLVHTLGELTGGIAAQFGSDSLLGAMGGTVTGTNWFGFSVAEKNGLYPTIQRNLNDAGVRFVQGELYQPWFLPSTDDWFNAIEFVHTGLYLIEVQAVFKGGYPIVSGEQHMVFQTDSPASVVIGNGTSVFPVLMGEIGAAGGGGESQMDGLLRSGTIGGVPGGYFQINLATMAAATPVATTTTSAANPPGDPTIGYCWVGRATVECTSARGAASTHPRLYVTCQNGDTSSTLLYLNVAMFPFPRNLNTTAPRAEAGRMLNDRWPLPRRTILANQQKANALATMKAIATRDEILASKDAEIDRLRKKLALM